MSIVGSLTRSDSCIARPPRPSEASISSVLRRLGVKSMEIKKAEQLETVASLIIPGGESTTMAKLAKYHNLIAFELAFFVWVPAQFEVKLCYCEHTVIIVTRVFLAVTTQVLCSYITLPCNTEYDADGGTEGFQGHARVIMPGISPCML